MAQSITMNIYSRIFFPVLLLTFSFKLKSQDKVCVNEAIRHTIHSTFLDQERDYWVSLPYGYSDSLKFPVIYVFDAEWRFELVRNIVFELGAYETIQNSIVVGIPHIDMEDQRGRDLTFSHSRIEYDGDSVDSTWYNESNSGGGMNFYNYLIHELMEDVKKNYAINDHETLIGHSYGGYFGGYILSFDNPFEVIHIYDPSAWFGNGEITERFQKSNSGKEVKIHLTYQPEPAFHRKKVEEFIDALKRAKNVDLTTKFYSEESHNSLFLDSFYQGIQISNLRE